MCPDQPDHQVAELLDLLRSDDGGEAWGMFVHQYSGVLLQVARLFTSRDDDESDCFVFVCEGLAANNCSRLRRFDASGRASFTTWLRAVARNLCLDWYRRRHGRRRPFAFLAGLSLIHRETFRLVFHQRLSTDQAVVMLRQRHPDVRRQDVEEAQAELWRRFTGRQRRELLRGEGGAALPLEEAPHLEEAGPDPEQQASVRQLRALVAREIRRLPARDRLVLRLRFDEELTLAAVARLTGSKDAQAVDRWIREIILRLRNTIR
jgi:RNA polymerase sigma factor (sigma-70 family)